MRTWWTLMVFWGGGMICSFRNALVVLVNVLAISLAGCAGVISGAGPSERAIVAGADVDSPDYELIDVSASTIGAYARKAEAVPIARVSPTRSPSIKLVPGDVLKIMISDNALDGGVFAPLATGGTVFDQVRVEHDGSISLPYVRRQSVEGKTLSEVERLIVSALKGVTTDVQVYVQLVGDLSGSVLVVGAVKQPGRFSALQGPLTILDAINLAGGPVLEPHLVDVIVRNGRSMQVYSYQDLLGGNNRPIEPHSEIVLERARKRFIAMGAVNTPGLHNLPSANPSLLESLAVVGGLNDRAADATGVFIFRVDPQGQSTPKVFRLNMANPAAIFLARQFLLLPEDAIYVTNAAVYEWQKIISPIVQVMLLGRTVNNGF